MNKIKLLSLLGVLSLTTFLTADNLSGVPSTGWGAKKVATTDQGKQKNKEKKQKAEKSQKTKQRDLFVAEVGPVYLKPYQGGTDFAQQGNSSDVHGKNTLPYGTNKGLDFDYSWGVRAGLAYQNNHSRQEIRAEYLYLASDASKSTTSDYDGFLPQSNTVTIGNFFASGGFGGLFNKANSKWNLHFNMLDLLFGKKYPKKGCMTFEPFIGLKGIILSENQKSYYYPLSTTTTAAELKQDIDFKGVGPIGGLSLDWAFTKWLSFIGTVDAAFLYSSIETKRTSNDVLPTLLWIGKSHDIKGTPVIDGTFALRGVYCWKSGRFIDLKIGFEGHYIFETMKHTVLNSDSSTNLSLMGWFATVGFGF